MLFAFADRLRQLRHKKNCTLGMLADRLSQKNVSVGQAALGKYEAGRIYPRFAFGDLFLQLSQFCGKYTYSMVL